MVVIVIQVFLRRVTMRLNCINLNTYALLMCTLICLNIQNQE